MEFKDFKLLLQRNFEGLVLDATHLFEVAVDKDEMWNLYLDSFPAGTNEVFRERREHDCSCCRHFIKAIGNVVVIKNNVVKTIWDFEIDDPTYAPVVKALSMYVRTKEVTDVWFSREGKVGTDSNYEESTDKGIIFWQHFSLKLPKQFVNTRSESLGEIKGSFRDTRNVFKRSLEELTEESILTVLELISQNSLYKGEEWKGVLQEFLKFKRAYMALPSQYEKDNYTWEQSVKIGGAMGRIRNHSIGTLLVNISEDMDLDEAVKKYEAIVAPENYKRPQAIFTKKMLEDAKKSVDELGYSESLPRRFATLDDITVNNILFSNRDSAKRISGANVFDDMANEVAIDPKRFSRVEEIAIADFLTGVLPTATELEVFLENRHSPNMVSLIAPENRDCKTMFKWNNGFSWAYAGNITDSSMRENVKSAGGKVDGVLRFSIQWNDDEYNPNDFDAHCYEPNGNHIYYGNKTNRTTIGELDVDIINPVRGKASVENITWATKAKMLPGVYKFYVQNYNHRGGRSGFKAEIEFNGQIFSFDYNKELRMKEDVPVAEVTFNGDTFTINEQLPSSVSSREIWNLDSNTFVPVSVLMFSPNYWDEQQGIGHRHYFFMLKRCVNPENPNGFYNEFLKEELMQHKRVFEALGGRMAVKPVEDQLSGVGFSSTKRNDLLVRVKGQSERVVKIKF